MKKSLSDARVHTRARFVKNHEQRLCHASASKQHLLPFPLRKHAERFFNQGFAPQIDKHLSSVNEILPRGFKANESLQPKLRESARHDGFERRITTRNLGGEIAGDPTDLLTQDAKVDEFLIEPKDLTARRPKITARNLEKRCFTGTIRSQHGPVFSGAERPIHVGKDLCFALAITDAGELNDGR
jgi:hypothetical protein